MQYNYALTGTAQVETAVVVATITTSGNASVIVTAACLPGGSRTLSVAVLNLDDASAVALAIRTALAADEIIALFFTVSGAAANVVLTRLVAEANDTSLNIAVTNDTCVGITPDATSNNTTAGTGSYDVQGEPHTISHAVLTNDPASANTLYYGRPALPATAVASIDSGATYLDLTSISGSIRQGMVITGGAANLTAGTKVLRVEGSRVYLDQPAIDSEAGLTLTFISILDTTTGVPVVPGEKVHLTPSTHRPFLQQGFRVFTAAGESATLRMHKLWN